MHRTLIFALLCTLLGSGLPNQPLTAQDGSFVEGLFRTIAEAQLERERRKRMENGQGNLRPLPGSRHPLPPGRAPLPNRNPQAPKGRPTLHSFPSNGAPRVGSTRVSGDPAASGDPAVQRFTEALAGLIREIKFLTSDLRTEANTNPNIRSLLPSVYQLTAQAESMLAQVQSAGSLAFLGKSYQEFDAALRQLSFQARSVVRLDREAANHLKNADRFLSTMSRQLGTDVQIDRHALHDKLIIASTYIQSLLDDLPLVPHASQADLRKLGHEGRLLKQAILKEADHIEDDDYGQLCSNFTGYADRWRAYAARVAQLDDQHLNLRLQRIGECGDQTYAILLIKPPVSSADILARCERLHELGDEILDQLTLRTLTRFDSETRIRVGTLSQQFDQATHELHDRAHHQASLDELAGSFGKADQSWAELAPILTQVPKINRATISSIQRECDALRRALGVTNSVPSALAYEDLVRIAASLEGTSEYLKKEIARDARYIEPSSLRRDLGRSSDDFYDACRHLHGRLYDRRPISEMRRDAKRMVQAWGRLATAVNTLSAKGSLGGRAERIAGILRDLQPNVASMAATLTVE